MAPRRIRPTVTTDPLVVPLQRTRRRRRAKTVHNPMLGTSRSGAATGMGQSAMPGPTIAGVDQLASNIRGIVEGFALAHGSSAQQTFGQLKKYLSW